MGIHDNVRQIKPRGPAMKKQQGGFNYNELVNLQVKANSKGMLLVDLLPAIKGTMKRIKHMAE